MMRYERKYRLEHASLEEIRLGLLSLPFSFRTEYPDRWVNSIYFDTLDRQLLGESLEGQRLRSKVRIRWYGDLLKGISSTQLEVKSRAFGLGDKLNQPFPTWKWDDLGGLGKRLHELIPSLPRLEPVLINRYFRSYFISFDGKIRATVDRELQFWDPKFPIKGFNFFQDTAKIVELKYNGDSVDAFENAARQIPFPLGKNSKYVSGMALIGEI